MHVIIIIIAIIYVFFLRALGPKAFCPAAPSRVVISIRKPAKRYVRKVENPTRREIVSVDVCFVYV